MGWYRIDPETGMPLPETYSRASTPNLLWENAFPGVDDDPDAFYFGDGPMDMADAAADDAEKILRGRVQPTEADLEALFAERRVGDSLTGLTSGEVESLLRIVAEFWDNIDWCYEEDWDRPAREPERRQSMAWAVGGLWTALNRADDEAEGT